MASCRSLPQPNEVTRSLPAAIGHCHYHQLTLALRRLILGFRVIFDAFMNSPLCGGKIGDHLNRRFGHSWRCFRDYRIPAYFIAWTFPGTVQPVTLSYRQGQSGRYGNIYLGRSSAGRAGLLRTRSHQRSTTVAI